ncbi:MAG: hypothetical protein IID50_12995 [Proteobacteria bacterium]|nr:hypothetical protein [Pseudomonadota bacterium]
MTAYSAFFTVFAIGVGALALDVGRMTVLRSQMQDRADAGAMAAAVQLDGRVGAQTRATAVAMNAMSQTSGISGDGQTLNVQTVNFYSEYGAIPVAATGDKDSRFVEVILEPRRVDFLLEPVVNPSGADHYKNLAARAVAGANPFICAASPLMICDPGEADSTMSLALVENIGRQIVLKMSPSGGGAWGPGNYGLLALPDGTSGANSIEGALAAVQPEDCYTLDVTTAPGVKAKKVRHGINSRFDLDHLAYPAPDVINYPKDVEIEADPMVRMGSGNWPLGGLGGYWAAKHGGPVPGELDHHASRYQVYLYEQGLEFGRDHGKTIYPVNGALPGGYTLVSPAGPSIPVDPLNPDDPDYDGVPSNTVAPDGYARRLMKVAVLQCIAEGVRGKHSYPTNGNFVEIFITEAVDDKTIYAELVRPLSPSNDTNFHANVKLVQ